MNNLERYVEYVQPVVKVVRENHNMFHRLEYYNLSAEDLFAEYGLIEFQTEHKHRPEHFSGNIPMVYAQWGEETGASLVLEISPEQRKLLSPKVVAAIKGDHLEYHEQWRKTADKTVYLLMDHEHYETCSGFTLAGIDLFHDDNDGKVKGHVDIEDSWINFLSDRLGLTYLKLDYAITDLENIIFYE